MFNWIKRLLGINPPVEPTTIAVTATEPLVLKEPVAVKAEQAKPVAETKVQPKKPAAQKPKANTVAKPKKETKASLDKLTKLQIEAYAKEKFNVDLDRRKTKEAMIEEFLKAQKAK